MRAIPKTNARIDAKAAGDLESCGRKVIPSSAAARERSPVSHLAQAWPRKTKYRRQSSIEPVTRVLRQSEVATPDVTLATVTVSNSDAA